MFLNIEDGELATSLRAFYGEALATVGLRHRYITISDWKFVVGHEIIRKVRREQKIFWFIPWTTEDEVTVAHFVTEPHSPIFSLTPTPSSSRLHVVIVDEKAVHPIRTFCRKFEERFNIRASWEILNM